MAELPEKNFGTLGCFDFWGLRMEGGPWGRRFLTSVFIAVLFLSPQNQAAANFIADDFSSLSRRLSIPSRIDPERAQAKKTVTIPGRKTKTKSNLYTKSCSLKSLNFLCS